MPPKKDGKLSALCAIKADPVAKLQINTIAPKNRI